MTSRPARCTLPNRASDWTASMRDKIFGQPARSATNQKNQRPSDSVLGPRIDIHGPTQPDAGTDSPLRVSGSGRKVRPHNSSVPTSAQHRHQSGRCAAVAAFAGGQFRRRWTRLATFERGGLPSGARARHSAGWRPDRGVASEQETKTKVVSQKQHTTNRGGVMLFFVDARRERRQSTTNRSPQKKDDQGASQTGAR